MLRTLALVAAVSAVPYGSAVRHPLDGPDLDLRIAITEQRVTLQVLMNLAFVDELVTVPRADAFALHEREQPSVERALFAWYQTNTRLALDGIVVAPTLAAFAVDPGDPRLLPMFPVMGTKALIKVRLHLQYSALRAPEAVNLVWKAYPPNLLKGDTGALPPLDVQALVTAGGTERVVTLRHDEPEYTWHAPPDGTAVRLLPVPGPPPPPRTLPLPLASLGILVGVGVALPALRRRRRYWPAVPVALALAVWCWPLARVTVPAGGGVRLPTIADALTVFAPLHANIYRAFDYTEPSDVYDALARSVQGDLLDTLYRDVYRSLVMQDEGGAVSRVQAVRTLRSEVEHIGVLADARTPAFTLSTRWQVDGAVFHWGHQHWRTNEHSARYTVIATDAGWRIAGAEVLEQRRVDAGADGRAAPGEGR